MVYRDNCDLFIIDPINDSIRKLSRQGKPQILEDFAMERRRFPDDFEGFFDTRHELVAQSETSIVVPLLSVGQILIRLGA